MKHGKGPQSWNMQLEAGLFPRLEHVVRTRGKCSRSPQSWNMQLEEPGCAVKVLRAGTWYLQENGANGSFSHCDK